MITSRDRIRWIFVLMGCLLLQAKAYSDEELKKLLGLFQNSLGGDGGDDGDHHGGDDGDHHGGDDDHDEYEIPGCFEVFPDFGCGNEESDDGGGIAKRWRECLLTSYNDAFAGIAYIEEVYVPAGCEEYDDRRILLWDRHLMKKEKKKKKKKGNGCSGMCAHCPDHGDLPSDCTNCHRRQLSLRRRSTLSPSPNEKFRQLFYNCLVSKIPVTMSGITFSQVLFGALNRTECPELEEHGYDLVVDAENDESDGSDNDDGEDDDDDEDD